MILELDLGAGTEGVDTVLALNHAAAMRYGDLVNGLTSFGNIGGNPTWAGAWCAAFDEAAGAAVRTHADLVGALAGLHRLTSMSLTNHAEAEDSAVLTFGRPGVYRGDGDAPRTSIPLEVDVRQPPSVSGGAGGGPWWWAAVQDQLEGLVWPDADTDRLRAAAAHWRSVALEADGVAAGIQAASAAMGRQRSTETALAIAAYDRVSTAGETLAATCRELAESCDQHAADVDQHRSEILEIGAQLAAESVGIQVVSHLFAVPTLGGSEVAGQAAQAARIAAVIARVRAALAALATTVTLRLGPLRAARAAVVRESPGLRRIADARVIHAHARWDASVGAMAAGMTSLGRSTFRSPAGLMYGRSRGREHRLTHVLLHAYAATSSKSRHTLFRHDQDVLRLIDEGWRRRSRPLPKRNPSDPRDRYLVPMGRVIGSRGETDLLIVVHPAGQRLITAYPR